MKTEPNTMENLTETQRYRILSRTSFKNVSGNWQFKGDMTPDRFIEIFLNVLGSVAAPKEEPKEEKPQWKKDGWGVNPVELKSMADRIRKATGSGIDLEDLDILLNIVGFSSLRDQLRQRDELIKELATVAEPYLSESTMAEVDSLIKKSQKL